ncbi:MAG: SmdA family multidrug ABC transporter permease/ATP-binding protein [Plesiomonas sp.]
MGLFRQLSWFFRQQWKRYIGAIGLLISIAFLELFPPMLVGRVVDGIDRQQMSKQSLFGFIAILLGCALAVYLLRVVWRVLLFGASYRLAVILRQDIYRQLSRQHGRFYLKHRTGDLMARATNDIDRVVFAAGEGVLTLVDSMVMGLAVLFIMSTQLSWQLTLLALLPMPIMAAVIKRYGDQLHHRFRAAQAAFSSLNNNVQETLTSIRMIKAFGLETRQMQHFSQTAQQASERNMHVARVDAKFNPTIYAAIASANLLAVGGGSWMVVNGHLTLGQLTSFVMYLGLMIWPMLALAWMFNIVERGSAAYVRVQSLLEEDIDITAGHLPIPTERGVLSLNITQFLYPENPHPVLQQIDIQVTPGMVLGLCGATGSGKSTLLALVQRQFDVAHNEITFHALPLTDIALDAWRARLAVVSQTPFLFSATIAENIAFGRPESTLEQVQRAAELACVADDIAHLPQGYQTQVGERGVMLSGGQKQRIAIARALLLDAEILILDDALSAVDGQTEHRILHNLKQWRQGRTMLVAAHRLSALAEADEIVVLQQGRIIQRGKHDVLRHQSGWYQDMYQYQQLEQALEQDDGVNNVEPA